MTLWKKQGSKSDYLASPLRNMEEGIFTEAWNARGGGMWAGLFGAAYGAVAGLVIGGVAATMATGPVLPVILGAVGLSAISGLLIGRSAGAENGSAAGAAVGSTRVILAEIRQKFKGIQKDIDAIKAQVGVKETSSDEPAIVRNDLPEL